MNMIWFRSKHFIVHWRILLLILSLLILHLDNLNILIVEIIVDFRFSFILDFPKLAFQNLIFFFFLFSKFLILKNLMIKIFIFLETFIVLFLQAQFITLWLIELIILRIMISLLKIVLIKSLKSFLREILIPSILILISILLNELIILMIIDWNFWRYVKLA